MLAAPMVVQQHRKPLRSMWFTIEFPIANQDTCGFVGLDYANTVQKPVRFAKAVVLDADSDDIVVR